MAAKSTARALLTFLVVLSVVGSLVVGPVAAGHDDGDGVDVDGDDGVTVDEDGVSVGDNDTNLSVDGSGDVDIGVGGSEVDCTVDGSTSDPTDACDTDGVAGTSSTAGDAADVGTPDTSVTDPVAQDAERTSETERSGSPNVAAAEDEEPFPVNYSDLPLGTVPVDLCDTPDPTEGAPDVPPAPDPVPSVPVNPNNPPSAPLGLCDVFNPYSPPFDPTNPPDDPYYETDGRTSDGDTQRAVRTAEVGTGDGGPFASVTLAGANGSFGTAWDVGVTVNDGEKDYSVTSYGVRTGDRQSDSTHRVTVFGKSAGANVVCDGTYCTVTPQGTPALGLPKIPVSRNASGGGGDTFPCSPPVDPTEEAPDIPTEPPEQVPGPVRDQIPSVPVNPNNPPSAPLGICDVYNLNEPPVNASDPDPGQPSAEQDGRQSTGETKRAARSFGVETGTGQSVGATVAAADGDFGSAGEVYVTANDGQKDYVAGTRGISTDGPRDGTYVVETELFRQHAGVNVVCDGTYCSVTPQGTPALGLPKIPVSRNASSGGDTFPCSPPVDPTEQAPDVPPTPDPVPSVPVNPNNPPSAPLGLCDVYNPNEPPVNTSDPDPGQPSAEEDSRQSTGETMRYVQTVSADTGTGQSAAVMVAAADGDFGSAGEVAVTANDGQKDYGVAARGYEPNSINETDGMATVTLFGKNAGAVITCDGDECSVTAQGTPALGLPSFPAPPSTGQDDGSTTGSTGTADDANAADSTARSTGDTADSTAADAGTSADSTAASVTDTVTFPDVFTGGVDAADATSALVELSE